MTDDPARSTNQRRVAFCTFGCRLNQYDTESLNMLLKASGRFRQVPLKSGNADLFVVNTCSVTHQADASARKAIRRIHSQHPDAQIVVTGCYAQRAPEELADIDGVSLVIGAADRARIVEELDTVPPGAKRIAVSPVEDAVKFLEVPITEMMERSRAYVKVQEGCNESCTFCIVPQTRGASRSRDLAKVIDQVNGLVESGYREIILTGVHVGDYGLDLETGTRDLGALIRSVLAIPGLERLRLSSIEPASITEELIELVANEEKFARHFHIPFQSGNDEILARMQRRYTVSEFRGLVERIAVAVPECGIGSDVICGFPGETDRHFQDTFDCLVELPITYIHPFTYSSRPGSAAEDFADQIAGDVKKRRTRALKRLSAEKVQAARERHVGALLNVLPERESTCDLTSGSPVWRTAGWSDNYLKVELESDRPVPEGIVAARVLSISEHGLRARVA